MPTLSPPMTSLWTASARTPDVDYPRLERDAEADVAVVGGGFTGLSVALHLAEKGRRVVVLEAESIGFGASGRNGGQVNPGLKYGDASAVAHLGKAGLGLFQLGQESTDFLAALVARKQLDCAFIRPGLVRLGHHPAAIRDLATACRQMNERGIAARMLAKADVERMVGTGRYPGGLYDPRGGSVHPLDMARELARAAAAAGARIQCGTRATALEPANDGFFVRCGEASVRAGEVVVATNAYSDRLVPGLAQSLIPVNSFQVATEPLDARRRADILPERNAVYDSRRVGVYFRLSPDDRLMLGGRASFNSRHDTDPRRADYDVIARDLIAIFPQIEGVRFDYRWTGLIAYTPDHLPHYHNPMRGLHVLLGFNGRGVALTTRAGAWLARKIMGEEDTGEVPATPIRPIPLHAFREPAANAVLQWHRLMDRVGR